MLKMKIMFIWVPLFIGCSGGMDDTDSDTSADTGTDGTEVMGDNLWGDVCGEGEEDCPTDLNCVFPPLPDQSTTVGYCSPTCGSTEDCTDGFFGPGRASCFAEPDCVISCDEAFTDGTCPEGLTCMPTGGPTNACGVPSQ